MARKSFSCHCFHFMFLGCSPKKENFLFLVGDEQRNDDDKYLNKKQEFPPNK